MPGIDAVSSPMDANSTTVDHVHAESVPIDTSVSIVVVPWRRFIRVARWKPHPHQKTIGVASAAANHSQPSNISGGTIETSTQWHTEHECDDPPATQVGLATALGLVVVAGLGRLVAETFDRARNTASSTSGSCITVARPFAKLTWADSTPSSLLRVRWIRFEHAAQVMPSTAMSERTIMR